MREPKLVVEHREELIYLLVEAAVLEHMVLLQYLYATFSLKQRVDEGLAPEQLAGVERWRKVVDGIAVQEMLHLALASNLLAAVGMAPTFTRPSFPQGSRYFPPGIEFRLLPFGEEFLRHSLFLERPEGMDLSDAAGIEPSGTGALPVGEDEIIPAARGLRHRGPPVPGHRGGLPPPGRQAR
jgi:Ferritin-like